MESKWVDFKVIKQSVTLLQVLERYKVKLKKSGKELRGKCPIHDGEGTDTFHANTGKNVFHCFSCGAKGNVLDLVANLEHCTVREAGLKLQTWFAVSAEGERSDRSPKTSAPAEPASREQGGERAEPNKPLGFLLQSIDHHHPYLKQRGIDPETAEYFGVGFFYGRGSMQNRVVIPIENEAGEVVAYAGRAIDQTEPKYKLPVGFHKSQVVFNLPRALEDGGGVVVVVEGFFDCMNVVQAEHVCVALMGCSMSEVQQAQLAKNFREVIVMLDGDEAGRKAAGDIASRLAHHLWVRIVDVPDGRQPDQLSTEELQTLLKLAPR